MIYSLYNETEIVAYNADVKTFDFRRGITENSFIKMYVCSPWKLPLGKPIFHVFTDMAAPMFYVLSLEYTMFIARCKN